MYAQLRIIIIYIIFPFNIIYIIFPFNGVQLGAAMLDASPIVQSQRGEGNVHPLEVYDKCTGSF